jgi:5-methylcytosine-specific restriction endonuclease McrA
MARRWHGLPRRRRLELFRLQCGICPYCSRKMTMDRGQSGSPNYATVDHVTARAVDRQPPSRQVITLCCRSCNVAKSDRPLLPFLLSLTQKGRP